MIRDHGLRAVYGNWAFQKNSAPDKEKYAKRKLGWAAYVGGKRESRRLLGDVILCQQDVEESRPFPDACVTATWGIDLHYPLQSDRFPGEEFRSSGVFHSKTRCVIPYRCLYSRNVPNLFMAGRDISATHVALAPSAYSGPPAWRGRLSAWRLRCAKGMTSAHAKFMRNTSMS